MKYVDQVAHEIMYLSHDIVSGSDITSCNKIDKPLVTDFATLRSHVHYNVVLKIAKS